MKVARFVDYPDGGVMYGAILGDIIGSPYEFHKAGNSGNRPLFCGESRITDDTIMTVAVADALLSEPDPYDDAAIRYAVINRMRYWGRLYPNAGYGLQLRKWLTSENPKPYDSDGNGSAMRVSSVSWLYDTLELTRHIAALTAEVTHNHPEGIKGAEAVACAIFMARQGASKDEIADYVTREFHYDLDKRIEELRHAGAPDVSCKSSVSASIIAFLNSESFEETMRTTVLLRGDTDTAGAIAGSIAEAYFGIPQSLKSEVLRYTKPCLHKVIQAFDAQAGNKRGVTVYKAS